MLIRMCGRYARYQALTEWLASLGADLDSGLLETLHERDTGPRYNIPPGTNGWIAALDADGRVGVDEYKWTFPTSRGNRINIRSETAHIVPEYREHFDKHRCVVFASGFYEPKGDKETEKNRPWYFFRPKDQSPLFLGAVVKDKGYSILTRKPVEPVASIHDRTPVFIPTENVLSWLDPEIGGRDALKQFAPPEYGERLECWHVSDAAKRPANEGPELIARVAEQGGLL